MKSPSGNQRVSAALDDAAAIAATPIADVSERLPRIPDDVTPESTYMWIERTIQLMDPASPYRKALESALHRQRFRSLRNPPSDAV